MWSVPEGTVVFAGETLVARRGAAAASSVGRDALADVARRIRRWWRRRRPGSSRWPGDGHSSSSVPGAATARSPVCWRRAAADDRRFRRHQSRRGRAAAGNPGDRDHGPLLGPVVRDGVESVRDLRPRFPGNTTLLVDTYDTLEGVRLAASIEPPVQAIRIDSGDLGSLGEAGSRNPRSARPLEREDRRLRRSRRIPDRTELVERVRRSTGSASEPS